MTSLEKVSFHEATVARFCRDNSAVELELEDVLIDGVKSRLMLTVFSVISITVDGEPSSSSLMESEDGEVLTLDVGASRISIIIEWNDFSRKKSFTKAYEIRGGDVSISIES